MGFIKKILVHPLFLPLCWILVKMLCIFQKESEDLARASREQAEPMTQTTSKAVSGAKGNGLPNNGCVVFADEFDPSVAALNIVCIVWHL